MCRREKNKTLLQCLSFSKTEEKSLLPQWKLSSNKKEKMKAIFISGTGVAGVSKDRWECPACRKNPDQPECRFNLSPKKRGSKHKCRFCGIELELPKNENNKTS